MGEREPTGARESGEGDRFHVLWAVRRSLRLLDPQTSLSSVQMEELTPVDVGKTDPEMLSGVDLSEYYGGDSIDSADRVVVSQLKYSSRAPGTPWTAARIARNTAASGANKRKSVSERKSVAKRLGAIYRELRKATDRKDFHDVLEIVLVSNQPCATSLSDALRAAKSELTGPNPPALTAVLNKRLSTNDRKELNRLKDASGLQSREFVGFLRVFRLELGQAANREQGFQVTARLSEHVKSDLKAHRLALYDLILERGLVGGSGLPITAEDLLLAMDVVGRETLFPAPAAFKLPVKRVPTPDAQRVLSALGSAPGRRLIAHGAAGVGKTTTILDLERLLPAGSVVVRFDCFAGGGYMDPDKVRHQPEVALLQICNDLAVQTRLPLLLVRPSTQPEMWRLFANRIAQAQEFLDSLGARLVLVIDAADNSVWAAQENGGKSFVEDLWRIALPDNAGLIVTARTGRLGLLSADKDTARIKLKGFDLEASAALLRTRFDRATDGEALEFHTRSQGNPRAQAYVLDERRATTVTSPAAAAAQVERTPVPVFRDLWETAVGHASDRSRAEERLAELLSIQRPVSIARFAQASGARVDDIRTFCEALVPGLRITTDDSVVLNDEDFEHYLRSQLAKSDFKAAHRRLAEVFLELEPIDDYAATVVASHLYRAGRRKQVRKLALQQPAPVAIADPLLRRQVYMGRIRLALAACRPGTDREDAARLLMLAGRASTADRAVQEAIVERPELAVRFGDPDTIDRIWGDPSQIQYRGPLHVRLALKHAHAGEHEPARAALRMANAWLRRRHARSHFWRFDDDDLAACYESKYYLDGWDAALTAALKSSQGSNAMTSGMLLVERLAARLRNRWSEIEPDVLRARLPAIFKARLLAAGCGTSAVADRESLKRLAAALLRQPARPDSRESAWRADFVELVARSTHDRPLVLEICAALAPAVPQQAPREWGELGDLDPVVRIRAMEAACQDKNLALDDVRPRWPEEQDERESREQATIMGQKVAPLLPLYLLRARAFVSDSSEGPAVDELEPELERMESSTRHPELRTGLTRTMWSLPIAEFLMALPTAHPEMVDRTADICSTHLYARTEMAERLLGDSRYRNQALDLIDKAAAECESLEQPARETMEFLFGAAESVCRDDEDLAGALFARAVAAAAGMDDEGAVALEAHCRVSAACHGASAASELATRLGTAVARHKNRVSENGRLPWRETLAAVAHLDPPSGLRLLARWESEGSFSLADGVDSCVVAEVEAGFLTPDDAFELAALGDEQVSRGAVYRTLLTRVLEDDGRPAVVEFLGRISLVIRRDLRANGRRDTADAVCDWADTAGLGSTAAVQALTPYRRPDAERTDTANTPRPSASDATPDGVVGVLEGFVDEFRDVDAFGELGAHLGSAAAVRDRVPILEAICAIPTEHSLVRFYAEGLVSVLAELLSVWGGTGPVDLWRKESLDSFIARVLPALVRYPAYERDPVLVLERIYSRAEAGDVAIQAAADWLGEVSSNGWFVLAGFVGAALSRSEAARFLDWSLTFFESAPIDGGVVETETRAATLARFAYALFGHTDRRVRWRMAHAYRGLIARDDGTLLDALLVAVSLREPGSFADHRYPFLWQSAKTWAYMTIARAARDGAAISSEAAAHLQDAALDTDWPHAAIREFARRASLVLDGEPLEDSPTTVGMANRPAACLRERKSYYDAEAFAMQSPKRWRFSLDTGAYWLGRVGQPFGLDKRAIAAMGDYWLVDRMGEDPESRPAEDTRFEHVDYYARSNSQGAIPRYELGRIGLEYHAVQLVAGALIDERRPMRVPYYEEQEGAWIDWLDAHVDSVDGRWLSDVRDPTPPQPEYLTTSRTWPEITDRTFDLMLGEPAATDALVVDAWTTYSRGDFGHGDDWIESAIVARATTDSLVRALADPALHERLYFAEGVDDEGPATLLDDPFAIRPWLRAQGRLEKGLQADDPLSRISPQVTLPAERFVADLAASLSDDGRSVVSGSKRIAWIRAFDDDPPSELQRHQTDPSVSGQHTVVDLEALATFLKLNDSVLLVRCRARRHNGHSAAGGQKDEHSERRFYVFEPERGLREVARAEESRSDDS